MTLPSRVHVAIALLAAALLIALLLLSQGTARDSTLPASSPSQVTETAGTAEIALPPEAAQRTAVEPMVADPLRVPTPVRSTAADCIVIGRLVDEHGRPLAGVPVRLYGYGSWADGHDVPRLAGMYDFRGWEIPSGADGSFRFEVPVPTVAPTQLRIEPDPFHDSAWWILGGPDASARPPLRPALNDLGEILLVGTGAIRGRVTTSSGAPLEGAELRIAQDPTSTLGREGLSDASGSYVIAHVKPGSYGVAVNREGYLSAFAEPFVVEVGRFTTGVDFTLQDAPVLAGRIVDQDGRGLEGAELEAWPTSSGRGAFGKSGPDGAFQLALPVSVPYTLEVQLEGFESHGLGGSSQHEPGSDDLRIVLHRSENARTRFVVVDAATGVPVERFGIEIERDQGSAARHGWSDYRAAPTPRHHPGGTVELAARPGLDRFTLQAPGYLRFTRDVSHAGEGDPRQVVALVAGGTLTGRVMNGEEPAAGASVRLEPGRRTAEGFAPSDEHVFHATADDAGRFRFDMLDPGDYRVVARAGAALATRELEIPEQGPVDAGELVLGPAATILGRVLVPPGRSLAGLDVYLGPRQLRLKSLTDAQGGFRFEGLSAGEHDVLLATRAGVLTACRECVRLAAGETREVVLDARGNGTCNVRLTLSLGARRAAQLGVRLLPTEGGGEPHELGTTDQEGEVSGWAPVGQAVRVELRLADRATLLHPQPIGPLELDALLEAHLHFSVGSLQLELPPAVTLPAEGWLSLVLTPVDDPAARTSHRLGLPAGSLPGEMLLEGRTLLCKHVFPGDHELQLTVIDAGAPAERIPDGAGYRIERRPLYRASVRATVRADEITRLALP